MSLSLSLYLSLFIYLYLFISIYLSLFMYILPYLLLIPLPPFHTRRTEENDASVICTRYGCRTDRFVTQAGRHAGTRKIVDIYKSVGCRIFISMSLSLSLSFYLFLYLSLHLPPPPPLLTRGARKKTTRAWLASATGAEHTGLWHRQSGRAQRHKKVLIL